MKHKITRRLTGYFSAVLLLFSAIIGILFWTLFTWHTAGIHEQELKDRAVSIAETLSQFPQRGHQGNGMGGGYGAYLRFIDEIAMSEVWLVDERAQTILMGHMGNSLSYEDLPSGAENLVRQVFDGYVETNREFSSMVGVPSVTVGAPVRNANGDVIAALLLHSPVSGMDRAQRDGIMILVFCILAALILATALSILLAHHFIEPLKIMEKTTEQIMQGNYSARTGLVQNDEIGSLACNLDKLSIKLSEVEEERIKLDKMRQDFVSNISHELRTPVTVIKGSLEVLEQGLITDPQEIREYFHQMLADIMHLQRLVNDLLELSRLQNTNFEIEKTELNLTDVLLEAIRSMRRISEQRQVTITLTNEIGAFLLWGDYGRLRQIFTIILDNAIKFSPPQMSVEIKMKKSHNGCIISISDHGNGIPMEDIPHIFDRFYRERSEQNKCGSGLGLSIAKQIADRHHVTIQCHSTQEKETCFSLSFERSPGSV